MSWYPKNGNSSNPLLLLLSVEVIKSKELTGFRNFKRICNGCLEGYGHLEGSVPVAKFILNKSGIADCKNTFHPYKGNWYKNYYEDKFPLT